MSKNTNFALLQVIHQEDFHMALHGKKQIWIQMMWRMYLHKNYDDLGMCLNKENRRHYYGCIIQ